MERFKEVSLPMLFRASLMVQTSNVFADQSFDRGHVDWEHFRN